MAQPYVGEIRMFGGNFAPAGWRTCDGQLLPISENETLFQLIGTTYGGDGQSTFALPDLRGRVPVHMAAGHILAQTFGVESVTLTTAQIPSHQHAMNASLAISSLTGPSGSMVADSSLAGAKIYTPTSLASATLSPGALGGAGGDQPHDNLMPYLCVNFIISLFGIYPSQN